LVEKGLNIITLPKTMKRRGHDRCDHWFRHALGIATEPSIACTAPRHSHHRIIIAGNHGHRAGWLTLGAGIAGGADVILIPEIPYDVSEIASAIRLPASTEQISAS